MSTSAGASGVSMPAARFDGNSYLAEVRELVVEEIRGFVPRGTRYQAELYDLVLDYPLRPAKGLRPALCVATCRALGGQLEAALPTAAVLELYHNAFLVHDDIEDTSELRRGEQTLHREHGLPIAINVGDAMLALALKPLLENTRVIGLGRALRVLEAVSDMATRSAEGQALELHWIHRDPQNVSRDKYVEMVEKKTAHYSFVTPIQCGAIIAGASDVQVAALSEFARALGIAFQIQDDLLNLDEVGGEYGKERYGDLWEGKYTLMLIETLSQATADERAEMQRILAKPRPVLDESGAPLAIQPGVPTAGLKTEADVQRLAGLLKKYSASVHAEAVAKVWAGRAKLQFEAVCEFIPGSVHRDLLHWLVDYTVQRTR